MFSAFEMRALYIVRGNVRAYVSTFGLVRLGSWILIYEFKVHTTQYVYWIILKARFYII